MTIYEFKIGKDGRVEGRCYKFILPDRMVDFIDGWRF